MNMQLLKKFGRTELTDSISEIYRYMNIPMIEKIFSLLRAKILMNIDWKYNTTTQSEYDNDVNYIEFQRSFKLSA